MLCLLVWLFSTNSYAEIYSGNCGYDGCDSVQWKLDTETKTLEIFCKYSKCFARMRDYRHSDYYYDYDSPWYGYRDYIQAVTLSGVSNIGNYAFYNCSSLTSVTIPNSVTNVGNLAFYNCK